MKTIKFELWRANVTRTIESPRGQRFLKDLLQALDALPRKRLIKWAMRRDGDVCSLGAVGWLRGIDWNRLDTTDFEALGRTFGISALLAAEIARKNDKGYDLCVIGLNRELTPEERFMLMRMWVVQQLGGETSWDDLPASLRDTA